MNHGHQYREIMNSRLGRATSYEWIHVVGFLKSFTDNLIENVSYTEFYHSEANWKLMFALASAVFFLKTFLTFWISVLPKTSHKVFLKTIHLVLKVECKVFDEKVGPPHQKERKFSNWRDSLTLSISNAIKSTEIYSKVRIWR